MPNQKVTPWIIKYLDEPMNSRNLILHQAQANLNNLDFSELLVSLIHHVNKHHQILTDKQTEHEKAMELAKNKRFDYYDLSDRYKH